MLDDGNKGPVHLIHWAGKRVILILSLWGRIIKPNCLHYIKVTLFFHIF